MLGADLGLALTYVPLPNRGALAALFAIDRAMGDVVRSTKEPMLGPIRLPWGRGGRPPPAEPRLQQAERELIPRKVSGRELAALESGWLRMFDPFPWTVQTSEAIWFRGNLLFGLGARILERTDEGIQGAGGLWALIDAARHCSDPQSRALLGDQARSFARSLSGVRVAGPLRPLSMLTVLAIRDSRRGQPFEREGTAGRAAAMLRHRFAGRLPKG